MRLRNSQYFRVLRLGVGAIAVVALLGACGGDDGTTSAGEAAGGRSEAAPPGTNESPGLRLVGKALRFDKKELQAAADEPFTIVFDNREAVPHNVAIYRSGPPARDQLAATEVESGPKRQELAVPALPAGTYFYQCDVHQQTMTGTLRVA